VSRVLLLCPEPLGHRQPAGVGIRFLEFARALRNDGHAVTVISLDGGAVEGCTSLASSPEAILNATSQADVVVVQGHIANDLFAHGAKIPVVVDFYDPYVIENLHYWKSRGDEVFAHDHATTMRSLMRGDFFLCASDAQRLFYLGMMTAAGRLTPEIFWNDPTLRSRITLVPFGVPPPRDRSLEASGNEVLFGGIYDWYTPKVAVQAMAIVRERFPDARLTFNTHPNAEATPQSAAAEVQSFVRERGYGEFVRFEPWVAYENRSAFYDRFRLALVTFPPSLETDLSMRTRIFDFLWAGLPVVTSSAPGTDAILERYGAGRVVKEDDPARVAAAVVELLENPDRMATFREGAARFTRNYQWPLLLEPLLAFCRKPTFDVQRPDAESPITVTAAKRSLTARIRRRLKRVMS
jgi:glycosyltransferase involved in cell wall biosynthesis